MCTKSIDITLRTTIYKKAMSRSAKPQSVRVLVKNDVKKLKGLIETHFYQDPFNNLKMWNVCAGLKQCKAWELKSPASEEPCRFLKNLCQDLILMVVSMIQKDCGNYFSEFCFHKNRSGGRTKLVWVLCLVFTSPGCLSS